MERAKDGKSFGKGVALREVAIDEGPCDNLEPLQNKASWLNHTQQAKTPHRLCTGAFKEPINLILSEASS
jgi:hypothetical protein